MARVGILFPGQLSEYVGMGRAFYETWPECRPYFACAEELSGLPLRRLMFDGPIAELRRSEVSQTAVFLVAYVAFESYRRRGLPVDGVSGYSLGNYAALCAAGAVDFELALSTILRIFKLSGRTVELGDGGMAAIIGIPPEELAADCAAVREHGVAEIGNYNTRTQLVVTGERRALTALIERVSGRAIKAQMLEIDWPVHSSVMQPVCDLMRDELAAYGAGEVRAPRLPYYSQFEGRRLEDAESVRFLLANQVGLPSRWDLAMAAMLADGFDTFVEVGPGAVLGKILRWISREARVYAVQEPAALDALERDLAPAAAQAAAV